MYCVLYSSQRNAVWNVEGVETVSAVRIEENDTVYFAVTCQSFHLTSFAILVDVYGVTEVSKN